MSAVSARPIVLYRRDPARNMSRFYTLSVEPSLFGDVTLIREWGRIGTTGHRKIELYKTEKEADIALASWLRQKRQRGYRYMNFD